MAWIPGYRLTPTQLAQVRVAYLRLISESGKGADVFIAEHTFSFSRTGRLQLDQHPLLLVPTPDRKSASAGKDGD